MPIPEINRAALAWFARTYPGLAPQIDAASISGHEHTSAGFFSKLHVPQSVPGIVDPTLGNIAFDGCAVFASNLEPYAECILHIASGRLSSLEVVSVGSGHPAESETFEVRGIEINRVALLSNGT